MTMPARLHRRRGVLRCARRPHSRPGGRSRAVEAVASFPPQLDRCGVGSDATLAQCRSTEIGERELEALTLEQAERESGYSYSALQKMVATGRLRNVGAPHRPRVQRGDLPKKVRPVTPTPWLVRSWQVG